MCGKRWRWRERAPDLVVLVCAVGILVLSLLLEVRADGHVEIRGWAGHALPEMCAVRRGLGFDCPGCGLTRSFVHLAHGNWQASWGVHRVGWLVALLIVVQIPVRMRRLIGHGHALAVVQGWASWDWSAACLVVAFLLIGNWLIGFSW